MLQKQTKLAKEEEDKKPKLTFDLIRQIKQAYSVSREDRPKLEGLENLFAQKVQEIEVKIGNKVDDVEYQDEVQHIKEKLKELMHKIGAANSKSKPSALYIDTMPKEPNSAPVFFDDSSSRKYIERCMEEVDKKIEKFDERIKNLEESYGKHSVELKTIYGSLSTVAPSEIITRLENEVKELAQRVDLKLSTRTKDSSPLLNYTLSSKEPKTGGVKSSSKIIINNNADKLETEKNFREVDRKIQDLRTDTFRQFDYTEDSMSKFKVAINKILERQDQSILSILTRVTTLEIRVDGLEADEAKAKTIDTGLGRGKGKAEKMQLLESLQIAEKLVQDFRNMRKEVFNKLYEIQEKDIKQKADINELKDVEAKIYQRFITYENDTKKYKNELRESIKSLQERIKKQGLTARARSPGLDIDTSAILSKRNVHGFK